MQRLKMPLIWRIAVLGMVVLGVLWLVSPEAAMAAPGGVIKAAGRSTFGKIIFALLTVILLPFIIYYGVRSSLAKKRTKADLARLATQFPQYRWLDIHDRATQTFNFVWSAWSQQKMSLAGEFTTHWYLQNQQLQLEEWSRRGVTNVCHVVKLDSIDPIFVQHNAQNGGEGSRVVMDIRARVVDYLQDASGNIVQGDKKEGELDTVWTMIWQEGAWKLNKIEDGANELNYLFAPNEVPEVAGQKVAV